MSDLQGKTALVTGSTSGIGLAVAHELAAAGANVVTNSFTDTEEDRAQAKALADQYGVRVEYICADMSIAEDCQMLVEKTQANLGSLDILVNNAGVQHVSPVDQFPAEQWERIIAINLSSVFYTVRAALPMMRERGWGRVINIASAHGLSASPYKSAYVSSKHAVVGFTKTVALETAEESITVNAICPGYVLTPLVEAQIPDQMKTHGMDEQTVIREVMLARQPTREFVKPEQIGGMAVFLCSPSADQITGTALSVDGGWTAL